MKKSIKTLCLCAGVAALGLFGLTGCSSDEFANATTDTMANYIAVVDSTETNYDVTSYKLTANLCGIEYDLTYTQTTADRTSVEGSVVTTITALLTVTVPEYTLGSGLKYYGTSTTYYITLSDSETEGSFSGSYYYSYGGTTYKYDVTSTANMSIAEDLSLFNIETIDDLASLFIGEDCADLISTLECEYDANYSTEEEYSVKKLTSKDTVKYQVKTLYEEEDYSYTSVVVAEFNGNDFVSYTKTETSKSSAVEMTISSSLSVFTGTIETPDFVTEYETSQLAG